MEIWEVQYQDEFQLQNGQYFIQRRVTKLPVTIIAPYSGFTQSRISTKRKQKMLMTVRIDRIPPRLVPQDRSLGIFLKMSSLRTRSPMAIRRNKTNQLQCATSNLYHQNIIQYRTARDSEGGINHRLIHWFHYLIWVVGFDTNSILIVHTYKSYMLQKTTVLIVLFLLVELNSKPLVANKVIVALNCGSKDQQVDSLDKTFKYKPDESFVSGKSVDVDYHTNDEAKEADIKYTFEKRIYMYERHTYDQMTYLLPVKVGKVTLILKFAEMYFRNAGERVFNIKIGNKIVREDMDVVRQAGSKYAAHQEYIEVDVQKDGVYFQGTKITGGLVGTKIKLSFAKGRADNPIIQAIIVYHDTIENSPKAQYKSIKDKWDSQKEIQKAMKEQQALRDLLSIQKKKEKIVIRNDQLIIEKPEQQNEIKSAPQKFGFLRRLAMGPIGILGWSALVALVLQFSYKNVFLMQSGNKDKKE